MSDTVEVIVGRIGRAHGIRGDVTVEPRTDEPERRFAPGTRLREEGGARVLTVEAHRWHSGRLLVRFAEAADRTAVEELRGSPCWPMSPPTSSRSTTASSGIAT